jgi:hypothetical protein
MQTAAQSTHSAKSCHTAGNPNPKFPHPQKGSDAGTLSTSLLESARALASTLGVDMVRRCVLPGLLSSPAAAPPCVPAVPHPQTTLSSSPPTLLTRPLPSPPPPPRRASCSSSPPPARSCLRACCSPAATPPSTSSTLRSTAPTSRGASRAPGSRCDRPRDARRMPPLPTEPPTQPNPTHPTHLPNPPNPPNPPKTPGHVPARPLHPGGH